MTHRLALVGAGTRGRGLLRDAYAIRDQEYFLCDSEIGYPHRLDHDYADAPRDWAEDVSDLIPEITAVCDPSAEAREEAAQFCGDRGDDPTLYDSFDRFVDDAKYDAAIVATPNDSHAELGLALLETDRNVLMEKPIATTIADHDRLIDADRSSNGLYFVAFNLRSSPFYARLKALLDDGAVGDLGMIGSRSARGHFHADYSFDQARSGGALLDKNCHDFDLYNWYADADPVSVSAFGGQHVHAANTDVNDTAIVSVEYDNGIVAALELCMFAPFGQRTRIYELRGSDGLLRSTNEPGEAELFTAGTRETVRVTRGGGSHGGADIRQMKRFLRCLSGDAERPADAVDAKKADAVAIAGERAIADDTIVDLDANYDLHPR